MNLGTKLGYWDLHTESVLRHDDESVGVRQAFLAKMREKLDAEEKAMAERDAARVEKLMADHQNPVEVANASTSQPGE